MLVQSLGQEDPLEKEMATHSSTLAWISPQTEESGRLQSTGSQGQQFFPSIDGYPSAVVTLAADGNAATSTNVIPMYDQNGNPVNLTCNCNDVFGVAGEQIYFYTEKTAAV